MKKIIGILIVLWLLSVLILIVFLVMGVLGVIFNLVKVVCVIYKKDVVMEYKSYLVILRGLLLFFFVVIFLVVIFICYFKIFWVVGEYFICVVFILNFGNRRLKF